MAEPAAVGTEQRKIAVVTGANKGIGLEISRQLASNGISVILTARDETRGISAVQKVNEDFAGKGISAATVEFHQLDVADDTSVANLVNFINTKFGKLDILINNAAIGGVVPPPAGEAPPTPPSGDREAIEEYGVFLKAIAESLGNYELAREAININYYGSKRTIKALLPLIIKTSSSSSRTAKIVNVTSDYGALEHINNASVRQELNDPDHLTECRLDAIVESFLEDFKEGKLEEKGWPTSLSAYKVSKVALNAYTRILAKTYNPNTLSVNSVHPGFVKTDLTMKLGVLTPEQGAGNVVKVALLPDGGPSGIFYYESEVAKSF